MIRKHVPATSLLEPIDMLQSRNAFERLRVGRYDHDIKRSGVSCNQKVVASDGRTCRLEPGTDVGVVVFRRRLERKDWQAPENAIELSRKLE
jgi:hypothetical protein